MKQKIKLIKGTMPAMKNGRIQGKKVNGKLNYKPREIPPMVGMTLDRWDDAIKRYQLSLKNH